MNKFIKKLYCPNTGLLLIRIGVGIIFFLHGFKKITNLDGTTGFFSSLGIPFASFMALIVALVETLGGISMIVGIFTKISGLLLSCVMLVAIFLVKIPKGGFSSAEFELMLLLSALGISFIGSGKYSISKYFFNKTVCSHCIGGNCEGIDCKEQNCFCPNCKNQNT